MTDTADMHPIHRNMLTDYRSLVCATALQIMKGGVSEVADAIDMAEDLLDSCEDLDLPTRRQEVVESLIAQEKAGEGPTLFDE